MDTDELAGTWCRMWNDDPALAHDLVTDDARMWSGTSDRLDGPVGAAATEAFVASYRRERGNRFTPRVVAVDGADRVAYVWDITHPDGTVLTGADANVLRDGRVTRNWTLVGERRADRPDPEADAGAAGQPLDRDGLAELAADWTSMWNGETERADDLVADSFRIWFGARRSAADDLVGPDALAAYVGRHREGRQALRFAGHGDPVLDVPRQRLAFTWTAGEEGSRTVGGIDLFTVRDGRLAEGWSVTGSRPFTL